MFSVQQKRDISDAVQKILRATAHPELPTTGEVSFLLHVDGAESWSFADIKNNAAVGDPGVNPHNELMASMPEEKARDLIERAQSHEVKQTIGDAGMPSRERDAGEWATYFEEEVTKKHTDLEQRVTAELNQLKDEDKLHRKSYSELRFELDKLRDFLTPIMEDNVIGHHSDQLRNLMTALDSPRVFIKEKLSDEKITKNFDKVYREIHDHHTRIKHLEGGE